MDIKEYFREEGREEGRQQNMQQVVLNMLKEKTDLAFICKVTGLSEKKVKSFKNGSRK